MGKRIIAEALLQILTRSTLEHVTVADICDRAHVSRKTFYYHFHDIYDLLEWILRESIRGLTEEMGQKDTVEEQVRLLFEEMQKNRQIIINAYHSVEFEFLQREFNAVVTPLVQMNLSRYPAYQEADAESRSFLCELFTRGLTGILLQWFGEDMKPVTAKQQGMFVRILEEGLMHTLQ